MDESSSDSESSGLDESSSDSESSGLDERFSDSEGLELDERFLDLGEPELEEFLSGADGSGWRSGWDYIFSKADYREPGLEKARLKEIELIKKPYMQSSKSSKSSNSKEALYENKSSENENCSNETLYNSKIDAFIKGYSAELFEAYMETAVKRAEKLDTDLFEKTNPDNKKKTIVGFRKAEDIKTGQATPAKATKLKERIEAFIKEFSAELLEACLSFMKTPVERADFEKTNPDNKKGTEGFRGAEDIRNGQATPSESSGLDESSSDSESSGLYESSSDLEGSGLDESSSDLERSGSSFLKELRDGKATKGFEWFARVKERAFGKANKKPPVVRKGYQTMEIVLDGEIEKTLLLSSSYNSPKQLPSVLKRFLTNTKPALKTLKLALQDQYDIDLNRLQVHSRKASKNQRWLKVYNLFEDFILKNYYSNLNIAISSIMGRNVTHSVDFVSDQFFDDIEYYNTNTVFNSQILDTYLARSTDYFQRWLRNNVWYKLMINFGFDFFYQNQPSFQTLTVDEEQELFEKRLVLHNYCSGFQYYSQLPYSKEMRYFFMNSTEEPETTTFFNHQFKGGYPDVSGYFAITETPAYTKVKKSPILKFDQPLYLPNDFYSYKNLKPFHEELSQKRNDKNPLYEISNFTPFYVGWDQGLRKLVVTNRLLPRSLAGYGVYPPKEAFDRLTSSNDEINHSTLKSDTRAPYLFKGYDTLEKIRGSIFVSPLTPEGYQITERDTGDVSFQGYKREQKEVIGKQGKKDERFAGFLNLKKDIKFTTWPIPRTFLDHFSFYERIPFAILSQQRNFRHPNTNHTNYKAALADIIRVENIGEEAILNTRFDTFIRRRVFPFRIPSKFLTLLSNYNGLKRKKISLFHNRIEYNNYVNLKTKKFFFEQQNSKKMLFHPLNYVLYDQDRSNRKYIQEQVYDDLINRVDDSEYYRLEFYPIRKARKGTFHWPGNLTKRYDQEYQEKDRKLGNVPLSIKKSQGEYWSVNTFYRVQKERKMRDQTNTFYHVYKDYLRERGRN